MSITQNIEALIKDIPIIVSDLYLSVAADAKALIQQRVQEKGLNASGGKTPEYSDLYKKVRQRKGLQTSYMDLTNTGEMWRSTGVVNKEISKSDVRISIGGRDEFTQNKINWNSEKQFEVLKLSEEEEIVLQENFDEELTDTLLEYLER